MGVFLYGVAVRHVCHTKLPAALQPVRLRARKQHRRVRHAIPHPTVPLSLPCDHALPFKKKNSIPVQKGRNGTHDFPFSDEAIFQQKPTPPFKLVSYVSRKKHCNHLCSKTLNSVFFAHTRSSLGPAGASSLQQACAPLTLHACVCVCVCLSKGCFLCVPCMPCSAFITVYFFLFLFVGVLLQPGCCRHVQGR